MGVRLREQGTAALQIAKTLEGHDEVQQVLHPALPGCPGHAIWKRDFKGSTGLFSILLKRGNWAKLPAFVDHLEHFKMGFSWGGYESLILPARFVRTARPWVEKSPVLRLSIGLEDPEDLLDDLLKGLDRYAQALD